MGKNRRRRPEPQRPSASNVSPRNKSSTQPQELPFDSSNWMPPDDAYQPLRRRFGNSGLAAAELNDAVRRPPGDGHVPTMRRCFAYNHQRGLIGPQCELLEPTHWDEHRLWVGSDDKLGVVEGPFRSTSRPIIYGPVRGYAYFVWKPACAKRWPGVFASTPPSSPLPVEVIAMPPIRTVPVQPETSAPPRQVTAKEWITLEAQRLKRLDKIPVGISKSRGGKTEFAKLLEANMKAAAKTDPLISIKPVGWEYLRNRLQEWDLWPISAIE